MFKKGLAHNDWHMYVEERLSAYIDGQLSDDERANVRKHLQQCERCQASFDSLGWTIRLLKQVPAPPLPRQFTLPVPEPRPATAGLGWLKWSLAAGSAVAALILVFLFNAGIFSRGGGSRLPNAAYAPVAATLAPAAAIPESASFSPFGLLRHAEIECAASSPTQPITMPEAPRLS